MSDHGRRILSLFFSCSRIALSIRDPHAHSCPASPRPSEMLTAELKPGKVLDFMIAWFYRPQEAAE
jgi:hypothetical protein